MVFLRNLLVYWVAEYTRRFFRFIIFIFYILKIYQNDGDCFLNLPNTSGKQFSLLLFYLACQLTLIILHFLKCTVTLHQEPTDKDALIGLCLYFVWTG
jgi:hypothetical protein